MNLYARLNKFVKNALTGGTLLGAILFGAKANAEDVKQQEQKTIAAPTIDAPVQKEFNKLEKKNNLPSRTCTICLTKSPLADFDANSKAWYTINQLLGEGSDVLGIDAGFDRNLFGRIGQVALMSYLNYTTEYYSHEFSHEYETRKKYKFDDTRFINWSDWSMGFPKFTGSGYVYGLYMTFDITNKEEDEKAYLRTITNGLNQDELNAALVHRESVIKKNLIFDEAISYLITKNMDWLYILVSTKRGLNYKADYKPINELRSEFFPSIDNQGLWNDIDMYLHHLHRKGLYRQKADDPYNYLAFGWKEGMTFKGIELSKKELFCQALIADMFSIKTYDSAIALFNYLAKGKRNTKPFIFKLGRTEITPPQISHFLTKEGSFYDTNVFFNIVGKMLLETNLGTDVDFIGHGKVRHLRTGGRLHMKEKGISIRPHMYLNSSRGKIFTYKGISAGLEFAIGAPDLFEITFSADFNENDLIENEIKGKPNGIHFNVGLSITY